MRMGTFDEPANAMKTLLRAFRANHVSVREDGLSRLVCRPTRAPRQHAASGRSNVVSDFHVASTNNLARPSKEYRTCRISFASASSAIEAIFPRRGTSFRGKLWQ